MKTYYTIRFERNDDQHQAGEQLYNADNALYIGQTASCEVKLPNPSQFEDAVFAVIEKRLDGEGWKLIRLSPFREHEVRVNGMPIEHLHYLQDGDRITFEGQRQELLFNIRHDDAYQTGGIVLAPKSKGSRAMTVWMVVLTLVLAGAGIYHLYNRPMSAKMLEEAKQSVFQIQVDSVKLLSVNGKDTITLKRSHWDMPGAGTAFLTTDSLLVTARHCIEPWLNVSDTLRLDTVSSFIPSYVKMALMAVTHETLQEDETQWLVVSYCSVSSLNSDNTLLFSVKSTDFTMNKERDLMVEYGDFSHQYFWQSISARPRRIDMMMGDIAFMHVDRKGTIALASKEEMKKICSTPDHAINILGRPSTTVNNQKAVSADAQIKQALSFNPAGYPDTVIFHNGDIIPGFSGGPVLAKHGFHWAAVGVVSVTDKMGSKHHYSVPITEIYRKQEENKASHESSTPY